MADMEAKKSAVRLQKEIKEKTDLILESVANANLLVDLIELSDTKNQDLLLAFIKSVYKIFSSFLKDNKIFSKKNARSEVEEGEKPTTPDDPESVFNTWLHEKYLTVVKKLLQWLHHKSKNVQELSLCTLMKFLVVESNSKASNRKKSPFLNNLFGKIFDELVHPSFNMKEMIERFSEFLEYDDVRFYVLKNLSKAFEVHSGKVGKILTENAYTMLNLVRMQSGEDELGNFLIKLNTAEGSANDSKLDVASLRAHKKLFSTAWLGFLSLPLTPEIHKKVLLNLHSMVIPHLSDPKLLMDFLTGSYNKGGVTSLLALNGVFILIHKHNLDYPDFYKKLYALLEPGIFHVKYQARFFHLLDLFLSSTHLPAYLVAAFAKRLSYLGLSAPPHGAMLVINFVCNLLKRHPSCQVMIHKKEASKLLLHGENGEEEFNDSQGDPFITDEADPAKCNALQSSLWELKTLQQHYYPGIPTLVGVLEKPLGKEEIDIVDYFELGYDDLFEKQCTKVTQNNAVLEYQPPKGILGKNFEGLWSME